jgi:hypothetical protein
MRPWLKTLGRRKTLPPALLIDRREPNAVLIKSAVPISRRVGKQLVRDAVEHSTLPQLQALGQRRRNELIKMMLRAKSAATVFARKVMFGLTLPTMGDLLRQSLGARGSIEHSLLTSLASTT